MKNDIQEQVRNGLRLGMGAVVGILVMGLLVYGVAKIRTPEVDNSLFTFAKNYPPRLVGIVSATTALAFLWFTANRWARFLSGLFGYAVLGGIFAVAAGGFHSHIASLQLSRSQAAMVSVLYLLCCLLTIRFTGSALSLVDRIAASSALLLLAIAGTSNYASTGFRVLAMMVAIFAAASLHNRFWLLARKNTRET